MCHMLCVTCHVSCVTCHISRVTCHLSVLFLCCLLDVPSPCDSFWGLSLALRSHDQIPSFHCPLRHFPQPATIRRSSWCRHPICVILNYQTLEDMARYAGLLLAPAEGFGLRPRLFMLFWPIFGNFWCSVVTVVTLSSNFSNFERNQEKNEKNPKKS